jgi:hypothetical protein
MILIPNKFDSEMCYLAIDEDNMHYIRFGINDKESHIEGYYLFEVFVGGLELIGDIDGDLLPSIERDIDNGDKLIIIGVDEV